MTGRSFSVLKYRQTTAQYYTLYYINVPYYDLLSK
jgi:hypothetical protein